MEYKEQDVKKNQKDNEKDDILKTEEVQIEEISIDGVCGVY